MSVAADNDRLLTPSEAGNLLGVAPATLARWRCTGTVTIPYVKVGHFVRYRRADLEQWIAEQRVTVDPNAT